MTYADQLYLVLAVTAGILFSCAVTLYTTRGHR